MKKFGIFILKRFLLQRNHRIKKPGFTLIEILLAIFVLEIGLLALATFYSGSLQITKTARNQTIASNLAQGILEQELASNYEDLTVGSGSKVRYSNDQTNPFYDWYEKVDITYIDGDLTEQPTDTSMKKIIVTVYWQERGQEKNIQTASIKSMH